MRTALVGKPMHSASQAASSSSSSSAPACTRAALQELAAPRLLVRPAVIGNRQEPGIQDDERPGLGRIGAQRLGQCKGIAAPCEPPIPPLGQSRQPEDGPVDGRAAEQQPAQVVAGDVLDGLRPQREPVDPGGQHAVAQAPVERVERSAVAALQQLTHGRAVICVHRQELPRNGSRSLHRRQRLVAVGPQARIAGAQLRRHLRTSPAASRRPPRARPCRD